MEIVYKTYPKHSYIDVMKPIQIHKQNTVLTCYSTLISCSLGHPFYSIQAIILCFDLWVLKEVIISYLLDLVLCFATKGTKF